MMKRKSLVADRAANLGDLIDQSQADAAAAQALGDAPRIGGRGNRMAVPAENQRTQYGYRMLVVDLQWLREKAFTESKASGNRRSIQDLLDEALSTYRALSETPLPSQAALSGRPLEDLVLETVRSATSGPSKSRKREEKTAPGKVHGAG